jgi:hypothetical protein
MQLQFSILYRQFVTRDRWRNCCGSLVYNPSPSNRCVSPFLSVTGPISHSVKQLVVIAEHNMALQCSGYNQLRVICHVRSIVLGYGSLWLVAFGYVWLCSCRISSFRSNLFLLTLFVVFFLHCIKKFLRRVLLKCRRANSLETLQSRTIDNRQYQLSGCI